MAFATELTIGTGNKVSLNYQSHEVSVSVTYQLEREDSDVVAVVKEKTAELAQAHYAAWRELRDAKVAAQAKPTAQDRPTMQAKPTSLITDRAAVSQEATASQGSESTCGNQADSAKESPLSEPEADSLIAKEIKADEAKPAYGQAEGQKAADEKRVPKGVIDEPQGNALLRPAEGVAPPLPSPPAPLEPATPGQYYALRLLLGQAGWHGEAITDHLLTQFGCERLEDLSGVQAAQWLLELQRSARANAQQQRQIASRNGK